MHQNVIKGHVTLLTSLCPSTENAQNDPVPKLGIAQV
jgi:hypothetical protein